MEICAIDNGYFSTKVKSKDQIFKFRSKIQKFKGELNADTFEIENVQYTIGTGNDSIEIKKNNDKVHKLCTLAGLSKLTDGVGEFKTMVALPMAHYLNRDFREQFKNYLSNPSITHICHQNKKKVIIIREMQVFMQGAAALYAYNPNQYKNLIAVVDIGGLTTNGCIFENLKPIPESMFTINTGMLVLYNKIKATLNQKKSLNIQDYEIPYLIKQKENIPREIISKHVQTIIREMRIHNWSVETLPMLGIGGGIIELEDTLKEYLPNLQISYNPLYDNVLGLYNIGKVVFS